MRRGLDWTATQILIGQGHVYACGPKTVLVKRTFLNIAIVGWGGVGWGAC